MPQKKETAAQSTIPSPYCYLYPNSNTLKNKYEITDPDEFNAKFKHETANAMAHLRQTPLPECLNSSYLKHLHKCLFENMFEWAGHTRDEAFTFADGTTATMPKVRQTGFDIVFSSGDKIQKDLEELDKTLESKNNLQDLTREEFTHEVVKLFVSLEKIHPFREGNEQVLQIFFEKLGQAAGHSLDFSVVTRERIMTASIAAMQNGNLKPMHCLFEDISHPEKISVLKEFMDNMTNTTGDDINDHIVMTAIEGVTYTGIYKDISLKSFLIDVQGAFIIGNKEHLTPEQLKTLQSGEMFSFTVPTTQDLEKILIPEETLAPLTKSELSAKIAEDARVHTCRKQIQCLSKTIYGNSKTLEGKMVEIIQSPELGQQLSDQIDRSPSSVANLVGLDLLCFKTSARANAEEHIETLCCAVANFADAVRHAEKEITQEHQTEQNRRGQKVTMPSKGLQDLLTLPKEVQKDMLENNPSLQKELSTLLKNIKDRLSSAEHKAIKNGNHETLAKSLGVSERKAQDITTIAKQAREAHQQVQTRTTYRSKALAMAS
ncbi:hypothetical protein ME1_01454 [Bartonella vinsonii subsp. arupensis OK-94-513]|uniref:protein adenylyltransferase n=1 Tax=Bartonella vinsonii subsp. arupensis OK-94-513 TaxID=1094562 RepID=J1JMC5_BARVI|nr:BID domain-containing T4SS effector [Bartonella vinsonii]EJF85877.1 hypothetical protein ME1_01454 [Bartonella vinsonii subsp. arupensis OK-94-513]